MVSAVFEKGCAKNRLKLVSSNDVEALEALEKKGREPKLHRLHSECYDYELFVARR